MKRVFTAMLALCLGLTIIVPGYASETVQESESLSEVYSAGGNIDDDAIIEVHSPIAAIAAADVIDVTVPSTAGFTINPYCLPVEIEGVTSTDQIVCAPMDITNTGSAAVDVLVSAIGIVYGSGAALVWESPERDGTDKDIFLYAEFKGSGDSWTTNYTEADNQILITDQDSDLKNVLSLDAGEGGQFKLFGSTVVNPTADWSADDVIEVTFTFTFTSDEDLAGISLADDFEDEDALDEDGDSEQEPTLSLEDEDEASQDGEDADSEDEDAEAKAELVHRVPGMEEDGDESSQDGEDAGSEDEASQDGEDADSEDESSQDGEDAGSEDDSSQDGEDADSEDDSSQDGEDAGSEDDSSQDGEDTEPENEPEPSQDTETTSESVQEPEPAED